MAPYEAKRALFFTKLLEYCNSLQGEYEIPEDLIYDIMSPEIGTPVARILLLELFSKGLLQQTRADPITFEITSLFLDEAEKLRLEAQKAVEHQPNASRNAETSRIMLDASGFLAPTVPASDRIVTFDHNSAEFRVGIEKLDTVIQAIQSSNAPVSYDKEEVLKELSLGRQLLNSAKVRVGAAVALILTPLVTVYNDVAAEALKPIVQIAIQSIKALLGL